MLRIFFVFFKIGLFTFGGGYSMIPLIHYYVVDKYKWISAKEFIDIIAIAESTPGPIAINSATYIGYKKSGVLGSFMATLGVTLPSLIIIILITAFLMQYRDNEMVNYAFLGIRVGVSVLILNAAIRIYSKVDKNILTYCLALFGFFIAFFSLLPIVFIILIGGFVGIIVNIIVSKNVVNKDV